MEFELSHEPSVEGLPLCVGRLELDLKVSKERRHELVNLEKAGSHRQYTRHHESRTPQKGFGLPDILADASSCASAELEHCRLHFLELRGGSLQPALRPEDIDILAENFWPTV